MISEMTLGLDIWCSICEEWDNRLSLSGSETFFCPNKLRTTIILQERGYLRTSFEKSNRQKPVTDCCWVSVSSTSTILKFDIARWIVCKEIFFVSRYCFSSRFLWILARFWWWSDLSADDVNGSDARYTVTPRNSRIRKVVRVRGPIMKGEMSADFIWWRMIGSGGRPGSEDRTAVILRSDDWLCLSWLCATTGWSKVFGLGWVVSETACLSCRIELNMEMNGEEKLNEMSNDGSCRAHLMGLEPWDRAGQKK